MTPTEELAALIAEARPIVHPTPSAEYRDFDWAAWDRAREDRLDAMGEPDRDGHWLSDGRRAAWVP